MSTTTRRRDARPLVGLAMGSDSDWPTLSAAGKALDELGVPYEVAVVSAHRTPADMARYGRTAAARGLRVLVAAAGGAAHLPGMLASLTPLPVVGVPVAHGPLQGVDALLSIVQMPGGVPVATVGVGNARNAGLLAARILGASDPALRRRVEALQRAAAEGSRRRGRALSARLAAERAAATEAGPATPARSARRQSGSPQSTQPAQ